MTDVFRIDGNTLEGVSATTLWTLHNRATEAKRFDGVRAARDIAYPRGRGLFKLAAWPVFDRVDVMRRIRPGVALLEFGS
jgi:hypothetical protein